MTTAGETASSRDRTRAYRARLRQQGMRAVTLWLPDTRTAAFRAQAASEARAVAADDEEAGTMAFLDAVRDWPPDEDVFWRESSGEVGKA